MSLGGSAGGFGGVYKFWGGGMVLFCCCLDGFGLGWVEGERCGRLEFSGLVWS